MKRTASCIVLFVMIGSDLFAAEGKGADVDRSIRNLTAFARTCGYVRFFHPSEQALAVDWDRLGMYGAEQVRAAADDAALRTTLLRIFEPITFGLQIEQGASQPAWAPVQSFDAPEGSLLFWQYVGIDLANTRGPYRKRKARLDGPDRLLPLFSPANPLPPMVKEIVPGIKLQLPQALPANSLGSVTLSAPKGWPQFSEELKRMELAVETAADWRVRVSGVITVWTALQHFHPYLDEVKADWDAALDRALRRVMLNGSGDDYPSALMEMLAATKDGHGYVYRQWKTRGGLGAKFAVIGGDILVTAAVGGQALQRGDLVLKIDGRSASEMLAELERHTPGSPHLSRFRALNQLGEGPAETTAKVVVRRGAEEIEVEGVRSQAHWGYFFKNVPEFGLPGVKELRPGIFYVNLYVAEPADLEMALPALENARGVIFDWRFDGLRPGSSTKKQIQPHQHVIPHLIDQEIHASPMLIPRVSQPDRQGWSYLESTWPVVPRAPRIKAKVVWINEPSCVSYGETCMAMIAGYKLGTLVGEPTAGCNGNASFIPLPGGLRVMWTAMDVRKHDRSSFYGKGFEPDVPVTRTKRGIAEGRDEVLEKALEVLEAEASG